MGVLAKKNMLYLLIIGILMCLFVPALIFAEEQRQECSRCSKAQNILNTEVKEKTEGIQRLVLSNFVRGQNRFNNEITLFVDPDYGFCDLAVKNLIQFKKDNPDWKVKGVIVTAISNLKEKLLRKQNYFSSDIEFSIDLNGNLREEFAITNIPSYVINYKGSYYKIAGQPDLNEILSNLNK